MKQIAHVIMLTICFIVITITFSCKKTQQGNNSKTELITSATWKRTAFFSTPAYDWNSDGNPVTDIMSIMWPCEKDNIDSYSKTGIFETSEGASKCNPADPDIWTAAWAFSPDETKVILDGSDEYIILELTATTLRLVSTYEENGVTYMFEETYKH